MQAEFEYVVWFQDPSMPPDDEDFEWPAVFVIVADSSEAALSLAAENASALDLKIEWIHVDFLDERS